MSLVLKSSNKQLTNLRLFGFPRYVMFRISRYYTPPCIKVIFFLHIPLIMYVLF